MQERGEVEVQLSGLVRRQERIDSRLPDAALVERAGCFQAQIPQGRGEQDHRSGKDQLADGSADHVDRAIV